MRDVSTAAEERREVRTPALLSERSVVSRARDAGKARDAPYNLKNLRRVLEVEHQVRVEEVHAEARVQALEYPAPPLAHVRTRTDKTGRWTHQSTKIRARRARMSSS